MKYFVLTKADPYVALEWSKIQNMYFFTFKPHLSELYKEMSQK
jgi:hypothetical protein